MTLELTTRFRGISTSGKSGSKRNSAHATPSKAVGHAMANLRYITRDSAQADVAWFGQSARDVAKELGPNPTPEEQRKALHSNMRKALDERAEGGGKSGKMVATRVTISLPNSWPEEAQEEALLRIGHYFAPPTSEALAVGALHRDKPENRHLHFLIKDGRESEHEALMRRAKEKKVGESPKRIRRRDVNRFNADLGRPKVIRAEIAQILNTIATKHDIERVEWKSFKERGIEKTPTTHRGPEAEPMQEKAAKRQQSGWNWYDGGDCESIDRSHRRPVQAVEVEAERPPAVKPVPQPATQPTEPAPAGRKAFVRGRWITLPDGQSPKKKQRKRDDEPR